MKEIKDFCTGIQHIGIPTKDLRGTIKFYQDLGFDLVYNVDNENEKVAFLKLMNLMIETYQFNTAEMKVGAIDHIAIDVKNIDPLFELIKKKNLNVLDTNVNGLPFWENGVKFFTIMGPNKEKIEFCERL